MFLSPEVIFFSLFNSGIFLSLFHAASTASQGCPAGFTGTNCSIGKVFFSSFSTHVQASSTEKRFELSSFFFMSGRTWVRKWKEITKNHGRQTLRLSTRRLAEQQNESLLLTLVLVIAVFE